MSQEVLVLINGFQALNVLLWQVALIVGLVVVFGLYGIRKDMTPFNNGYTTFQAVMYACFHRTVWPLALCWVVFSCVKGYGGQ